MTDQPLLTELEELKESKNNWYAVALIVSKLKESAGAGHTARRLKQAAIASGYNPNTLNRMLVVKDFLDAVNDGVPKLQGIDPNSLPFTTLEVVKRLHQVDPEQGIQMLLEVIEGKITIRKLREKYQSIVADKADVASAHQTARLEAREFEAAALKAVQASADRLYQEPFDLSVKSQSFPVAVVGYKSRGPRVPFPALGFDFFLMRASDQAANLDRLLQRTLFNCGFFRRYWVIFASTVGRQSVVDFCTIMKELTRLSVGVAVLPWGEGRAGLSHRVEDLEILLDPTGDPSPDWRHKIFAVRDLRGSMIWHVTS
ncbi:hypothetical protein KP005_18380 [Geomonas nitrogeniifigens]|uniref:Uncharacterized protein n=1 Tax=Geomonas diazotrophica TaxID=2843197 RepID=A0ABX8JKW1_9BACT|nr:hypothetical protein [Geomonas nitrogeniifigens]QWV97287.1 hypothetical protein KP005_18380 [Geomonas nitrogeniifigens]